jgi:uncharacterized membrane protein YkvI
MTASIVRAILVPGLVLQAVLMGGAYATGREIVQYFTRFDLVGGLYAIGFAFVAFLLTLVLTFEVARTARTYDYRSFLQGLVGRGWWLFEVLTIITMLLILAVVASAAGEALLRYTGWSHAKPVGQVLVLVAVGVLAFFGREAVMKTLTYWAVLTTFVFIALALSVLSDSHGALTARFSVDRLPSTQEGISGLQYALYSLSSAPLLLYSIRDLQTRAQAVTSASIAAVLIILPAVLIHLATSSALPEILEQPLPLYFLIDRHLGSAFLLIYSIILIGTLVDTSVGLIHGINERIDGYLLELRGRPLGRRAHAAIAVSFVALSLILSSWGIMNLVDKGYGTVAWGFLIAYLLPLFTVGLWRLARREQRPLVSIQESS